VAVDVQGAGGGQPVGLGFLAGFGQAFQHGRPDTGQGQLAGQPQPVRTASDDGDVGVYRFLLGTGRPAAIRSNTSGSSGTTEPVGWVLSQCRTAAALPAAATAATRCG
jgi:hypothetical protein